jgi:hypothetical protein
MKRPPGVTILAVLIFLSVPHLLVVVLSLLGAGNFLAGIPMLLMSLMSEFAEWPSHTLLALALIGLPANLPILVGVFVFLAVFFLVIGMAVLRVQNWARIVIIVLAILNIVTAIAGFGIPRLSLLRQSTISLAIEVVILIYLFQAKIKKVFGATSF